jgi:hypothetical protein
VSSDRSAQGYSPHRLATGPLVQQVVMAALSEQVPLSEVSLTHPSSKHELFTLGASTTSRHLGRYGPPEVRCFLIISDDFVVAESH